MATINEITAGSQYMGNVGLGGGADGVIKIDTKPLQDLAAYTVMYNKSVWEQKKKETDAKIKDLADLSNIALNDLYDKDKVQGTKEFGELMQHAQEYARKTPKNENERIQNELDWQKAYGSFKNNYNSGKVRAVTYHKLENDINSDATITAQQKDDKLAQLKEKFTSTDIGTPISAMDEYKTTKIDVPTYNPYIFKTVGVGANDNVVTTNKIFNPTLNAPLADGAVLGISQTYKKKGTPEYGTTPNEIGQSDAQSAVESQAKIWNDMAEPLNAAIKDPKYYDANGTFLADKFKDDNASNTVIMRAFNALDSMDKYSRQKYQEANAPNKVYTDKGLSFKLPENINPDDFKAGFIDYKNGVQPRQLVLAAMFAQHSDTNDKVLSHTGEANDLEKVRLQQAGETKRKGMESSTTKLAETIDDPAKLFVQHVNRVVDFYKRNPNAPTLSVDYGRMDKETRAATGVQPNQLIEYGKDGSYTIKASKDYTTRDKSGLDGTTELNLKDVPSRTFQKGQVISVGTIDNLKTGFTNAVKTGTKMDGAQSEGFQVKAEAGFNKLFGTNDATTIFNSVSSGQPLQSSGTPVSSVTTKTTSSSSSATKSMKGQDGKIYQSTDGGTTWVASDGTTVVLKKK